MHTLEKVNLCSRFACLNIRVCKKNAVYPSHGQNPNHGFSFWFQFPFSAGFQGKSGFSFGEKVVSVFAFSFCLREGVGVPLNSKKKSWSKNSEKLEKV